MNILAEKCMECNEVSGNEQKSLQFEYLKNSARDSDKLAYAVLKGSNESALDILVGSGEPRFIPGTYFTTMVEVVRFYGVKEKYLLGVMHRWGIAVKKTPDDVVRAELSDFLSQRGLSSRVRASRANCSGNWALSDMEACGRERLCDRVEALPSHYKKQLFISARVFLALAALMYYGRYVTEDGQAHKTLAVLSRSQYSREILTYAKPRRLPLDQPAPAPTAVQNEATEEAQEVEITGVTLSVTPEMLEIIVQKAVKAALKSMLAVGVEKE